MIQDRAKAFRDAHQKHEELSKRRAALQSELIQAEKQEDQARMEMTRCQRELIEGAKALA